MDVDTPDDAAWADDGHQSPRSHHEAVFDVEALDDIHANYPEARSKLNAFSTGAVNLDSAPEPAENVTKNKALKSAFGNHVFSYVAGLHKNLGHPPPEVLQRMLTEVQATEDVLKASKEYICPQCHERKSTAGVPPDSGLTAKTFADRHMANITWIDTNEGRVCVMVMMDPTTRYVPLRIMKSERSIDLVSGLERGGIKHFSLPKILRIDEAKGFAAQRLREWCFEHQVALEVASAEAQNWIGAIKRRHQVVRRTLEGYMDEKGERNKKTLVEAAIYCPGQINNLNYTNGYTQDLLVMHAA
eukprot:s171_g6.t1